MIGNLEEMMNEFKSGVYDLTENGKCTQCGECCSNCLPMTKKEISIIKDYIKVHKVAEQLHTVCLREPAFDMTCPFLDITKDKEKCTIYKVRPRICRDFICCKDKRKYLNKNFINNTIPIDVRETFFGGRIDDNEI